MIVCRAFNLAHLAFWVGHGLVLGDEAWGDGDRGTRSSPIVGSELATTACDYIALGHVHAFREVSTAMDGCGARAELGAEGSVDGPPAYYSGAPWGIGKVRTSAALQIGTASNNLHT